MKEITQSRSHLPNWQNPCLGERNQKDHKFSHSKSLHDSQNYQQRRNQMDEFHEDEELARAIALSLEIFNRSKSAGVRAAEKKTCAVPLCLPNNYVWNSWTGRCIKTEAERSSLEVVDEALEKLKEVKGPVCVVSVAGPYRKGKSYILSQAFDQPDVFPLGHEMVAETMGIWLWIVPEKYKVFKEPHSAAAGHLGQQVSESILRFFPGFEAFSLPPPTTDPETMKSLNQKKDQVNHLFLDGLEKFKRLMRRTLSPKHSFNDGEYVTGEGLAALVRLYVEAINTPVAIPNVQRAWDTFVSAKCVDVKQAALQTYDALMTSQLCDALPCSNTEIRSSHGASLEACEAQLMIELAGISTNTVEMASRELKESVEKKLASWLTDNEVKTRQFCKDLLNQLKSRHLDPVFQQLQGRGAAKVSFDDIIGEYQRIKDEYYESAIGAKDIIAKVFLELHAELLKEKEQYLGLLRQLKDFDEDLSRELVAKAYQEQERKRLEEQQSRLQQENHQRKKEMEMLIHLEEERKRFKEQMELERNEHRDQMENMMAASMRHAQEERGAFVRENQALQDCFLALQDCNEENMKMIKKLSDVAAKQKREKEELLQKIRDQADVDQETLIKRINDKHNEEMGALRDDMNVKLDEVMKQALPDETVKCGTPGLINRRIKDADSLQRKLDETHEQQQAVEKPGFWKNAMKFVGKVVVPAVGTVVSAVIPAVAPIVAPIAAVASVAIDFLSDHICSVM